MSYSRTAANNFDRESVWSKLSINGFVVSDRIVTKALPGWTAMGREDVVGILETEGTCYKQFGLNLWQAWENVWAPEEVYFPTIINVYSSLKNVDCRMINFAHWDSRNRDFSKRANPLWFDGQFDADLVRKWKCAGSLFGRKFRELSADVWRRVIDIVESTQPRGAEGDDDDTTSRSRSSSQQCNK